MGGSLEASWCVLRGAQCFNCCPRGEPCPPFFTHTALPSPRHPLQNGNTGSTINNSRTLFLLPPPSSSFLPPCADSSSGQPLPAFHLSTLRLKLASSFSVNPPNTSMCVIVLDSSWWWGYLARPSWYWAKGASNHVHTTPAISLKYL